MVARAIFDTLTAYDADLNVQPFLAESAHAERRLHAVDDHAAPDIKLHNGEPVDAEIVKGQLRVPEVIGAHRRGVRADRQLRHRSGPLDVIVNMNRPWVNYPFSLATQIGVVRRP